MAAEYKHQRFLGTGSDSFLYTRSVYSLTGWVLSPRVWQRAHNTVSQPTPSLTGVSWLSPQPCLVARGVARHAVTSQASECHVVGISMTGPFLLTLWWTGSSHGLVSLRWKPALGPYRVAWRRHAADRKMWVACHSHCKTQHHKAAEKTKLPEPIQFAQKKCAALSVRDKLKRWVAYHS